jgi:hypothetical protein
VVIGKCLSPHCHGKGRIQRLGFEEFTPGRRVLEAVEQQQPANERGPGAGRPGILEMDDPKGAFHGRGLLPQGMLVNRVGYGSCLDGG